MSSRGKEKDIYAKQYPEMRKWLNQCIVCQTTGYNPNLPEKIYPGRLAENIRQFYTPLPVNEMNVCMDCDKNLNP